MIALMLLAAVFSPFENRNSRVENSPGTITGGGYNNSDRVAEEVRKVFIPPANESLATNTNGARTGDTRWIYTVNSTDQLTSALESNPAPGTQALQLDFKYDWQGRMVERKATRAGAAVKRTTFLYDGWRPVRETEFDSTGRLAAQRVYTWGPDLSGSLEGVEGVGGLIEVLEKKGTTTTKSLAISDKANVTGLVDGSTGALVASYACAPYGEPLSATGERAGSCPFRFQTKYWDEDLRLYYFGKRWYDPATRTFLSRDPMRETGDGPNDMAAFRNQPLNYIDPLGGKSIEMIGDELRKAQDENGIAGLCGASPGALWDFLNPFDPSSPATEARHKFSGEALPQALTNLDAMSIPSPLKTFIKANIGFGLAGNAVNPLNLGVDLYDTGVTVNKIGFAATGKGIVDGIREQPAMFAGGLPVMLFTGRVVPRLPMLPSTANLLGKIAVPLAEDIGGTTSLALPAPSVVINAGGVIRSFVQPTDQIFYRVFTNGQTGGFLTAVKPLSSQWARQALALPPENTATFIQEVLVPAGTRLQRSRALRAFGARGGAEQFELLDLIPTENFGPGLPFQ